MRTGHRVFRIAAAVALPLLASLAFFACSEAPKEAPPSTRFVPDTKPPPTPRWKEVEIPAGTPIALEIIGGLSSATAQTGYRFEARVAAVVLSGNLVAVPEGSTVDGIVTGVTPAAATRRGRAVLNLAFEGIRTPTGAEAVLKADYTGTAGPGQEVMIETGIPIEVALDETLVINVRY